MAAVEALDYNTIRRLSWEAVTIIFSAIEVQRRPPHPLPMDLPLCQPPSPRVPLNVRVGSLECVIVIMEMIHSLREVLLGLIHISSYGYSTLAINM